MNPPEVQPDSAAEKNYFDPEEADRSEQFFSASLEMAGARPEFVVDRAENPTSSGPERSEEMGPGAARSPSPASAGREEIPEGVSRDAATQNGDVSSEAPDLESDWRDLVSAKVKRYKTLKPRKDRYPSLQLQFDSGPSWKFESAARAHVESINSFLAPPDPSPVRPPDAPALFPPTTESTARVLEFPRPGMLPFNGDELAEPVDRPRIVEAPELVPPPPALGGILIEPADQPARERQPGLDMPFATTGLSRRAWAAGIDGVVVGLAVAVFRYLFLRFNPSLPPMRLALAVAAGLAATLWFAYQSAFVVFCGTTPGLQAMRLKIARFDGARPARKLRRWRLLASLLSFVSLGLGYVWCFFDEDQLCWHDRITKTHLAPK
jgi:uncharacterized RDD family membrane protein YckC